MRDAHVSGRSAEVFFSNDLARDRHKNKSSQSTTTKLKLNFKILLQIRTVQRFHTHYHLHHPFFNQNWGTQRHFWEKKSPTGKNRAVREFFTHLRILLDRATYPAPKNFSIKFKTRLIIKPLQGKTRFYQCQQCDLRLEFDRDLECDLEYRPPRPCGDGDLCP